MNSLPLSLNEIIEKRQKDPIKTSERTNNKIQEKMNWVIQIASMGLFVKEK